MAGLLAAACSVEDGASDEDASDEEVSAGADQQARVADRVLAVVCDPDSSNRSEDLVPLVREVRARDGRSDRVWEVADEAECIAGPAPSEPAAAN